MFFSLLFFYKKIRGGGIFININLIIEEAFSDFEINKKRILISFLSYPSKADMYLTYYIWHEQPENFLDDEYHPEVAYGTIDIFSKGIFKDISKEVKKVLKKNNFTLTDNGVD